MTPDEMKTCVQQEAAGYTVYILSTVWPEPGGEDGEIEVKGAAEDGPNDLIKIGESTTKVSRIASHKRYSPLPVCLTATLSPFRDAWAFNLLAGQDNERWERAFELGLPAPTEWFRGGCEEGFLWGLLIDPEWDWVCIRRRGNNGAWREVRNDPTYCKCREELGKPVLA
jgi:hypothetical protein